MSTCSRFYFAYGSNLSVGQMRKRCPGAQVVGRAVLADHRLSFPRRASDWQNGGVAGIQPATGERVEGVVYEISDAAAAALDEYAGVGEGEYRRGMVEVELAGGRRLEALTYFAEPEPGGPFTPSAPYVQTLLAGAREHGLAEEWMRFLQACREF